MPVRAHMFYRPAIRTAPFSFRNEREFVTNTPTRALQISTFAASHHSAGLVKSRHMEGIFEVTAVDLEKINDRSYVLTERTNESRFNKWVVSETMITRARWIAKEWPPSKPTDVIKSAGGPHGEWLWNC